MIGRIYLTGDRTSWVILLTDLNSRIPVSIVPGNVQAIMTGDNTPCPRSIRLSQNVAVKAGDQVVTLGRWRAAAAGPAHRHGGGSTRDGFRVALLADAASSEDVEILDFKAPPEQPPAPIVRRLARRRGRACRRCAAAGRAAAIPAVHRTARRRRPSRSPAAIASPGRRRLRSTIVDAVTHRSWSAQVRSMGWSVILRCVTACLCGLAVRC